MNIKKRNIYIVSGIVLLFIIVRILQFGMYVSNANKYNSTGIKMATTELENTLSIEVHQVSESAIHINIIYDHDILTVNDFTCIRNFLSKLSKMNRLDDDIYVTSIGLCNSNEKGIAMAGVTTEDIFSIKWGEITDIEELKKLIEFEYHK